ncbi:MAG TPA: AfsA-related hotdog domain-containing protein [Actinocrinis sp.]|nr:AfsA-related hotdog domain-containing protein [Actinocrinis sp.]
MSDSEILRPKAAATSTYDAVHGAARAGGRVAVVGDCFATFAAEGRAATISGLTTVLREGGFDDLAEPVRVEIGQGVDDISLAEAVAAIEQRGLPDRLLLRCDDLPTPVETRVVHKRNPRNVLLAGFERTGVDEFEAALRISPDNELLLDHMTGLHIQGMVLIEAARQMFLAVCELHYTRRWPEHDYAFLLTSVNTAFHSIVFPLPARLRLTAHRAETDDAKRLHFVVETQIWQNGKPASTTVVECASPTAQRARRVEARAASSAVG